MISGIARADVVKQFQKQVRVGGKSAAILIIGFPKDEKEINKVIDAVGMRTSEAYNLIMADLTKLNANAGQGPMTVNWQTAELIDNGIKVSNWAGTDVLAAPGSTGGYKDVNVNKDTRTVEIMKPGTLLQTKPMMDGYIADLMIRFVYAAGMRNAMAKVGNVFRSMGNSMRGPWKISVQEDSTTFAKHTLNVTVSNAGAATVSANQLPGRQIYDPGKKRQVNARCKGATIIMNEASFAEGVAYAIMISGPKKGQKMLAKIGAAKGLIVDNSGKFTRHGL
jgi:thiamine biosynthesis lipoprotein ApbE